ncbi:nucleoside recognition domain-containing protein [Sediminibacterium goheungense]|uniref:Spore maturation protein SpmA n=1 Tax=Sediminibacterium goheungense TaxID=1086393 RepID=A0A4R6IYY0_9BACT|nr:nucleoside recognition domain-containing protein [Sediminibacterium goheungense]TDO28060.1 spore maturation protein SpmA [Sediminibacterium goheungense]
MALNIVWIAFFVIAFVIALYKFIFLHDTDIFKTLVDGMFDSAKSSVVDVAFPLTGAMVFFLGLMNIAEKAGAINWLARILNPFLKRLFPEVPEKHPAMGQMVMNFSANMLGLDNAATPFGLKAMEGLQSINPDKEKASNAQIMFLVLHTSGLTLIPLTIISYRLAAGSKEAASIFIPLVLATICTTLASIFVVGFKQKLKWDRVMLGWIGSMLLLVALMLYWVQGMAPEQREVFSKITGNLLLLLIVVTIILGAVWKKVNVFDAFIEGAKGGFDVIIKIIPYLVGMLVAIRIFRDSGALGYMVEGITWLLMQTGVNTDFTSALPVAIMKPFSGSGARGLMLDAMQVHGPDSFVGKLASTFQGSADTTFYIIALYFGSVGIKKVRYAIWAGMLADIIGVIMAIIIGYIFFH